MVYELEELGLSVSMPSDYVVFTRDLSGNAPNLSAYGLTKDEMLSLMTERHIYLNGWDEEINQEIVITMTDSSLVDFNLFSDMELTTLASSFENEYKTVGLTVLKTEIYNHTQAKFLKIYISQLNGSDTVYGLQYYTVYNNKAINITLQSYSGKISPSQETVLKEIVDSAHFDTAPQLRESVLTPSSAFTYTDPQTRSTFTVPANWVDTPLSKERETIDVKFMSQVDEGMCIMYGNLDVWESLSDDDRRSLERVDIDNSIFTKSDLADLFGLPANAIQQTTYGTNEYFVGTVKSSTDTLGVSISASVTHAMLVNNGYLYWFQFSGTRENPLYSDFEAVLSSLAFTNQANKASDANNTGDKNIGTNSLGQFNIAAIILDLLVTIVVYSLPIIIYRYAIRKKPVPTKKAKRITLIYAIFAFVVMTALIVAIRGNGAPGGAILLWSWVNYRVLIGGKDKSSTHHQDRINEPTSDNSVDDIPTFSVEQCAQTELPHQEQIVCPNCGIALPTEVKFCHKCGTRIN